MKKLFLSLSLMVAFTTVTVAQTLDEEIRQIQDIWGLEKKEIFKQAMNLPQDQAELFWPLYNEYESAKKELGKDRLKYIADYVDSYTNLSDEKATELTNNLLNNNIAIEKLQLKTFKKLSKVISPVDAAKFLQIEKYLDTGIRMQMQNNLPFIGELDAMRSN